MQTARTVAALIARAEACAKRLVASREVIAIIGVTFLVNRAL